MLVLILKYQIFYYGKKNDLLEVYDFNSIFQTSIKNNTILIYEPNTYHYECTPGYCKYFVDMGYHIDILMHISGIDSLFLFEKKENLRLFTYINNKEVENKSEELFYIILKYKYILVQTIDDKNKNIFKKLKLLEVNNSIFVCHNIKYAINDYENFFNERRIWTLANVSKGFQINPHYFGNIKIKNKNKKTRFFLTSTKFRNYTNLIKSIIKLKKENYNFQINIVGRRNNMNYENIPKFINKTLSFKYNVSYVDLYHIIENSDYIIIPLDPKNNHDNLYRTNISTGSIQLAYGFLKPLIINKDFGNYYFLNDNNSLLYNDNIYDAMKIAIKLNENKYKYLQNNLNITVKKIEKISINNINKAIN